MTEVCVQSRVFLQPPEVLGFLGRVAADLPRVPLHPRERSTTHVSWTCAAVLDLMHRADEMLECHRRPWTDFTTGDRSIYLTYELETDAFVALSLPTARSPSRSVRGGGVGSTAREWQRKRHRDLDGEAAAVEGTSTGPFRPPTASYSLYGSLAGPSVLPVPSLHPPAGEDLLQGSASRRIMSERADVRAVPGLDQALGTSADRPWQIGGLLRTLASWYLLRSDEARHLGTEHESYASELRRSKHEVETLRLSSAELANALERSHAERDRYRRERDELRALRVGVPSVPQHALRDPYEDRGYEPPRTSDVARPDGSANRWSQAEEVAMPPLADVGVGVPRHPSYCPSNPSVSGPSFAPNGPEQ